MTTAADLKPIDYTWNFVVKVPGGEQKSVVSLKSNGSTLTGTMNSEEYGSQSIEDGSYDGETLTWKSKTTKPMKLTLTYTAKLDADNNMSGMLKVALAKLSFTGTLVK